MTPFPRAPLCDLIMTVQSRTFSTSETSTPVEDHQKIIKGMEERKMSVEAMDEIKEFNHLP